MMMVIETATLGTRTLPAHETETHAGRGERFHSVRPSSLTDGRTGYRGDGVERHAHFPLDPK